MPRGLDHTWDRARLAAETIDLLRSAGAAIATHLVSDVIPLADAPALIADLAHRRKQALQVVIRFDP